MKAMKKSVVLSLVLVMALTLFLVGCSNNTSNNDGGNNNPPATNDNNVPANDKNDTNKNEEEATGPLFDEKQELSMMIMSHGNWPYTEEQEQWDWLEEATNVKINVEALEGEGYANQVNLSVASGEMTDLYWAVSPQTFNTLGAQGAFIDLNEHLDKMPNLKRVLEENPDRGMEVSTAEGKMYIAPTLGFYAAGQRLWLYRQDIFEEQGLEAPKTYDEIYAVAKDLKTAYPDSYPIVWRSHVNRLESFAPQFGINHGFYADQDTNKFVYGQTMDRYKLMLQEMNKWYDEGLLHPEWLTMTTKQWSEAVAADKSFMIVDYIGRTDYFNNMVQPEDPKFNMAYMPPPAGCDDCPREQMYFKGALNGMAIASTTENLDAALKYVDWFYSPEGVDMGTWGKSGEVFTEENGTMVLTPEWEEKAAGDFTNVRKDTGIFTNGTYIQMHPDNAFTALASEKNREEMQEALTYMAEDPYIRQPVLTDAERQQTSIMYEAIDKKMKENVANFIMGSRSFDEWDQHINELNELGLQDVLDTYTEAYQRMIENN